MNEIRVGRVSTINYAAGTVKVAYPDRSDKDTAELPVFCGLGKEYQMPKVGEPVLVLHLSNDSSMGIVLGGFWTEKATPKESGENVYYKAFQNNGDAFLQVLDGKMMLGASELSLRDNAGTISVSELLAMKRKLEAL